MKTAFDDILDLILHDTAFIATVLMVTGAALFAAWVCGAPRDFIIGMFGLGLTTAVIEFRQRRRPR